MKTPRKGIRLRRERRNRLQDATKRAKSEARRADRERRAAEAERRRLAQRRSYLARKEELRVRVRGTALEARRRLRPLGRRLKPLAVTLEAFLARIAPYVSRGLLFLIRLPVVLIALLLESTQRAAGWLRTRTAKAATAVGRFTSAHVTPLTTFAAVGALAAVALGVSQFFDYHAVELGQPDYAGEVGSVAPAPRSDVQTAGSAHLFVLVPVAIAALILIGLTYRGRWRLGRVVSLLGLAGIAVSLLVDLPQGLDAGTAGLAFSGAKAELIEGFWAQLAASAALVFCGLMLGAEARRAAGETAELPGRSRRPRLPRRLRRGDTAEVGTVAPPWGAES